MRTAREQLFALEQFGIKLGLEQIRALVAHLDHPDRAFPSIVIAGTNGKGSVAAMVERGLRAAGLRTGLYTSPHLTDLEERFAIDGAPIDAPTLDRTAARVMAAAATLPFSPSFFEATTAIALELFRDARVEIAVLEVGLGGRLDATNVVTPIAVAITAIDFDHEAFLGHTLEAIAAEKAGVIKENAVVVLSANRPEVEQVVASACERRGARLIRAEEGARPDATLIDGRVHVRLTTPTRAYGQLHLSLRGRHQVANAVTAIRLLEALAAMRGFDIPVDAIRAGVETAVWPARLELIGERPRQLLIDGAHNPAGARALASYLLEAYTTRLPLVIAVMRDKHAAEIVAALAPAASHIVATAAQSSRALSPAALLAIVRDIAPRVSAESTASSVGAVERAWLAGSPVVVAGSLYLAGEVRAAFS